VLSHVTSRPEAPVSKTFSYLSDVFEEAGLGTAESNNQDHTLSWTITIKFPKVEKNV
jgi:hypothetical protein